MSRNKAVQTDQTYCSQNTLPIIFMNNLKQPILNNNLPLIKKQSKPKGSIQLPKQTIQARDIIQKYYQQHDMKSFFNNRPGYKPNIQTPYKTKTESVRYSHVKPRVNTNLQKKVNNNIGNRSVSISFSQKSRTLDVKKSIQYRKIVTKTNTPKMSLYLQPMMMSKDQLILPRIGGGDENMKEREREKTEMEEMPEGIRQQQKQKLKTKQQQIQKQEQQQRQKQSLKTQQKQQPKIDYISTQPVIPFYKSQQSTKQLKDQSSQTNAFDKNRIISYQTISTSIKPSSKHQTLLQQKIQQRQDQQQDQKQISGISGIRPRKNSVDSQAFSVMTKPNFNFDLSRFGERMAVNNATSNNNQVNQTNRVSMQSTSNNWRKEVNPQITEEKMGDLVKEFKPKSDLLKNADVTAFKIKKYKNGVYFGELIKDENSEEENELKHGLGCIFYYNGRLYEGEFEKDLKNGKGYQLYPDSSYYHGDFKNGYKQGKGIFVWNNGEIYWGEWIQGKKHGSGTWKGSEGSKESYFGQWYNGKPHGFGVLTNAIGDVYEGEFKQSVKDGKGTERFINGDVYVGQYLKGRRNGPKETMYYKNGEVYVGEFCNNVRHGNGVIKLGNEKLVYEGEFQNDKKCGKGMLWGKTGIYEGNFQNDLMHGFGKVIGYNHVTRNGYWVNGKEMFEGKHDDHQNHKHQHGHHNHIIEEANEHNTSIEKRTERYKSKNHDTLKPHNRSLEIEVFSKRSPEKNEKKGMRSVKSDSKFTDLKRAYLTKQKKNITAEAKYKRRACGCLKKI